LTVQLINISSPYVFKCYSKRYSIFRDLYEEGLFGIEIRNISSDLLVVLNELFASNHELSYITKKGDGISGDFLALISINNLIEIAQKIKSNIDEDAGYKISKVIHNYLSYNNKKIKINGKEIALSESLVMGILNVTPDSFSDGGNYINLDAAFDHVSKMVADGADIIDVGGESTRPGAVQVPEDEELKRVLPIIQKIHREFPNQFISIDTTKSKVAELAIEAGAHIINDISSFEFDSDILKVAKKYRVPLVIMHIKGRPQTMQKQPIYEDVVSEVYESLESKIKKAKLAGVDNLIIDPGIGFGKRVSDNYELLNRLSEFKGLGYPIMVGVSKKSFLGKSLNINVEHREIPTTAAETMAINNGARIVRTHNVINAKQSAEIVNLFKNPDRMINV